MKLVRLDLLDTCKHVPGEVIVSYGMARIYKDDRNEDVKKLFNGSRVGTVFMKVNETELRILKRIMKEKKKGYDLKVGFSRYDERYSIFHMYEFEEEGRKLAEIENQIKTNESFDWEMGEKLRLAMFREHRIIKELYGNM